MSKAAKQRQKTAARPVLKIIDQGLVTSYAAIEAGLVV